MLHKSVPGSSQVGVEASAGSRAHTRLKPRLLPMNLGTDLRKADLSNFPGGME